MARKRTVLENLANNYTGYDDFAPLDSPGLLGVPTAPTAPPGTDSNQVATTAFVEAKVPLTTRGDILVQGASGPQRLPLGANGTMPASNGTDLVNRTIPKAVSYILSADKGYTPGTNIDITHPTGWVFCIAEGIGGGGGGSSGACRGAGVMTFGGGGASPGCLTRRVIFAADVTESFFRCIIGTGGPGGAAVSTDADGNRGTSGTSSSIADGATLKSLMQAWYGYGGGQPGIAFSNGGVSVGSEHNFSSGPNASGSGSIGGAGSVVSSIGAGGAGGGLTVANAWSAGGGAGRTLAAPVETGTLAGNSVGGTTEGASGQTSPSSTSNGPGRAGGGGASSNVGAAGAGGNGSKYGSAGGGGGAARLSVGASGKGGDGASGIIKLAYFVAAV